MVFGGGSADGAKWFAWDVISDAAANPGVSGDVSTVDQSLHSGGFA